MHLNENLLYWIVYTFVYFNPNPFNDVILCEKKTEHYKEIKQHSVNKYVTVYKYLYYSN